MVNSIKLAIFDLDDTLVHSSIDYAKIRFKIAELFPRNVQLPNLHQTPILQILNQLKEIDDNLFQQASLIVEKSERNAVEKASVMKGVTLLPELLEQYEIRGAIYTNNTKDNVKLYLLKPGFEFLNHFEIITRNDISKPKPDPEGLMKIINKWNIPKLNTIYIGDSFIDSEAAMRANIRFLLFNSRKIEQKALKTPPFLVLNDWSEFESFILKYSKFNGSTS
ncbi:MAG: HAD family hydrolase [Candidatus Hodarchaeales archaeon]